MIDLSSLRTMFRHYYINQFPSFWKLFGKAVSNDYLISVREILREIEIYVENDRLKQWAKGNKVFFPQPSQAELSFISKIFTVPHFQYLIDKKKIYEGRPVADPFVIAKAKVMSATVITEEKFKENAPKIPNVCKHFGIECVTLEEFMEKENWVF